MSSLTKEERLALEDIFLSISGNQSPLMKWQTLFKNYSEAIGLKTEAITHRTVRLINSRRNLKTYLSAKYFVRNKRQFLSKHFGIKQTPRRG